MRKLFKQILPSVVAGIIIGISVPALIDLISKDPTLSTSFNSELPSYRNKERIFTYSIKVCNPGPKTFEHFQLYISFDSIITDVRVRPESYCKFFQENLDSFIGTSELNLSRDDLPVNEEFTVFVVSKGGVKEKFIRTKEKKWYFEKRINLTNAMCISLILLLASIVFAILYHDSRDEKHLYVRW